MRRGVVVELHDVRPANLPALEAHVRALDEAGAGRRTLLVVPAGLERPTEQGRALIELLRREQAGGSEIVLHGYDHLTAGPLRGRALDVLRARLFAAADAEFLSIDRPEARRRLEHGRAILGNAGLDVAGFCAPGWLEPRWLPAVLVELGFEYDVGMAVLRALRSGRRRWLPWTGEVGAAGAHGALVGLGGAAMRRLGARAPVVKVFFHLRDAHAPDERVLTILRDELVSRRPASYSEVARA